MQIKFFSDGLGFVAHKYRMAESACRFSVWFNEDGYAIDAQRIDARNRCYPVTPQQMERIQRYKLAGLGSAAEIRKARGNATP